MEIRNLILDTMELKDLEIYQISREVSRIAWIHYQQMDWQIKKVIGDQWITAIDSVGANIAEGFGRYHYLDRNKFNLNARGSLLESLHWTEVLIERKLIEQERFDLLKEKLEVLHLKLNTFIASTRNLSKRDR